jgi:hypothetical protein
LRIEPSYAAWEAAHKNANPKKNGYCDRWGYKFKVAQVDGETRYCVTRK